MVRPALPALSRRAALAGLSATALPWRAALAAASPFSGAQRGEPRRGGTMTLALAAEPTTLVSATTTFTPTLAVSAKVTEGLLAYDFALKPLPRLAVSWTITPDGLTYTFKLRPGVAWHDGRAFTSDDVAYSIMLLKTYHPRGRCTFAHVSEVSTPDPLTAVFHLDRPAPYLITALAGSESPIVPFHIYNNTDPTQNPNNRAPIGTGPFLFKEWVRGSHVLYERNPHHWATPKPWLDRLMVTFIPDAAARLAAFETGRADLGYRTPVAFDDVARLESLPHLRTVRQGGGYSFNVTRLEFNLDNPYFRIDRVRRAVAHAVDRDAIVREVYAGLATACATPIAPGLTAFSDPRPTPYPYDPAAAEAMLDAAGFARKAGGVRFRVTLDYNPGGVEGPLLADYLRLALGRIGIGVAVRAQDIGSFLKRIYTDRAFDFTTNAASDLFDPTVGVQRLYWSQSFIEGVPFSNATNYRNPKVDALLEAAAVERDRQKRVAMFMEFQRIVGIDVPDLNFCSPTFFTVSSDRARGYSLTADGVEASLMDAFVTA